MKLLLEDQTTNTTGTQDTLALTSMNPIREYQTAVVYGDFDGATVTLEFSPDGGTTWITAGTETTFTTAGGGNFYINPTISVRFSVTSADAGTSVTAGIL